MVLRSWLRVMQWRWLRGMGDDGEMSVVEARARLRGEQSVRVRETVRLRLRLRMRMGMRLRGEVGEGVVRVCERVSVRVRVRVRDRVGARARVGGRGAGKVRWAKGQDRLLLLLLLLRCLSSSTHRRRQCNRHWSLVMALDLEMLRLLIRCMLVGHSAAVQHRCKRGILPLTSKYSAVTTTSSTTTAAAAVKVLLVAGWCKHHRSTHLAILGLRGECCCCSLKTNVPRSVSWSWSRAARGTVLATPKCSASAGRRPFCFFPCSALALFAGAISSQSICYETFGFRDAYETSMAQQRRARPEARIFVTQDDMVFYAPEAEC